MKPFTLQKLVLFCLLTVVLASTGPRAVSPDIVISQVYGGGGNSGAFYRNDFIELFNRGATSVNVTGWTVQYAATTGTTWQTTTLEGTISPGITTLSRRRQVPAARLRCPCLMRPAGFPWRPARKTRSSASQRR